ncbi:HEAT repeat protein [Phycisphaerae bacterium RAS1]|nr:HEAT repeat protein [Phycisphaerae bacterium RAS1]
MPFLRFTLAPMIGLAALLALSGCVDQTVRLSPTEQLELRRRAEDLLLRAAQSGDPEVATNAIEALVQVAPRDGLPRFRDALRSDVPMLRFAGCLACGEVRDRTAGEAIRRLLDDQNPRVRLGAAYAVYRMGDFPQAEILAKTLSDNPDEGLRADAAWLIGRLREPAAAKRLRRALREKVNEKSSKVTVQTYAALAACGDDEALDRVIAFVQGDPISRLLALQCLAEIGHERAREAMTFVLRDPEEYLEARLLAARGLGRLRSNMGMKLALDSTRFTSSDREDPEQTPRVRRLAAMALGDIGDPAALGALRTLAESSDDQRIQVAASYAICRIVVD